MEQKIKKIIEYSFLFFVFIFFWQTKLIIFPAETNYNEIALYLNYLVLGLILILFIFYLIRYKRREFVEKFDFARYWVILAGLEFFIFISVFISSVRGVSIFKYFLFLLAIGLLFLMTQFKFNFKKIISVFLLAILIQAGLGIFQFFSQETFSNKYLGIASHSASVLGVSVVENDWGRFGRAYGGTEHPNIFGALMFFGVIFLILFFYKNDFVLPKKIFFYLSLALLLLALLVSFSRGAYLALGLSLLFLFFVSFFEKKNFQKYLPVFSFSLVFLLVFFFVFQPLLINRFKIDSRLEKISIDERSDQLKTSFKIIKDSPWIGVGLGSYHNELLALNPDWKAYQAQPVHNVFLLSWAEIGLWGFIFFCSFLLCIIRKNIVNIYYFPVFIGLFVFMTLDHWLWSLPFGLLFMFFIISLTFYFKCDIVSD
ncbi:MAG: O-antigen ligase family protein [Patescibacteria group bacterium]|jgi:O-antigen ligase